MERRHHLRTAALVYSLRSASIFAGLPEEDLEKIAAFAVSKSVAKGEYLFREHEPAVGFYVVRKGIINVHRVASDGREQVIHLFRPGESLAEAAVVSETGYPADARAIEESEVILIPKRDFLARLHEDTNLALRMLASMSQHLRVLVASIESLKLKDTETRLLHWLLSRCPRPLTSEPAEIAIGTTKAILASELTTRQETLSRIFAKLRDAGHLIVKGRTITVNNPLAFQAVFEANLGGVS
ncbi:MAG TPA: Crp/Fnr family transcriptional regulator [Chthoniobacteraceae bacterium]|nr:Crp/Fnr family transcriptional regulator [Chthoniobacteraceae bacterium]